METKTIKLDGDNEVIVAKATVRTSLKRQRVMQELRDAWIAAESVRRGKPVTLGTFYIEGIDEHFVYSVYTDVLSATVSAKGFPWPVPYEEFADWDGALTESRINPWMAAILELNPHWYADEEEIDPGEADGAPDSE